MTPSVAENFLSGSLSILTLILTLDNKDIFGVIRGLSEVRYQRDLSKAFNEAAPISNEGLVAMHKTWLEVSYTAGVFSCHAQKSQRLLGA